MSFYEIGNLWGFPTDYITFSVFIGKIFDWAVGTLFIIWGLNLFMSMLRKVVLIIGGVRGE